MGPVSIGVEVQRNTDGDTPSSTIYVAKKGADQLHGNREADLRLCFRICKKPVFSRRGSFYDIQLWDAIVYI